MISQRIRARLLSWAGLWVAALLWAVNTQLGQILPYNDCEGKIRISAVVSAALAIVALLAGSISWRCWRTAPARSGSPNTFRFAAALSSLSALVFAFALTLQAIASMVLTGCEH
jgi:hypothetical protein